MSRYKIRFNAYHHRFSTNKKFLYWRICVLRALDDIYSMKALTCGFVFQLSRKLMPFCVVKKEWGDIWIRRLPNSRKHFFSIQFKPSIELCFCLLGTLLLARLKSTHAHTHAHMDRHTHTHGQAHTHTDRHTYTHIHMHGQAHTHIWAHGHTHIHIFIQRWGWTLGILFSIFISKLIWGCYGKDGQCPLTQDSYFEACVPSWHLVFIFPWRPTSSDYIITMFAAPTVLATIRHYSCSLPEYNSLKAWVLGCSLYGKGGRMGKEKKRQFFSYGNGCQNRKVTGWACWLTALQRSVLAVVTQRSSVENTPPSMKWWPRMCCHYPRWHVVHLS